MSDLKDTTIAGIVAIYMIIGFGAMGYMNSKWQHQACQKDQKSWTCKTGTSAIAYAPFWPAVLVYDFGHSMHTPSAVT